MSSIDTLQSMFPEWDRDALESIASMYPGNLEGAINEILSMSQEDHMSTNQASDQDSSEEEEGGGELLDMDLALAREISREHEQQFEDFRTPSHETSLPSSSMREEPLGVDPPSRSSADRSAQNGESGSKGREKRGRLTTLDYSFLRVPGYTPPPSGASITDLELALMFQQDEFKKQFLRQFTDMDDDSDLLRNIMMAERNDAIRSFQGEGTVVHHHRQRDGQETGRERRSESSERRGHAGENSQDRSDDTPTILDSLSSMGDDMKSKLRNFANKFRQNDNGQNNSGEEGRRSSFTGRMRGRSEEERGLLAGDSQDQDDENEHVYF